ncbi:hypothetical protein DF021_22415 [Burkholderia stagnalis]|uniref:Uncharacterized protein n=1 Tax=Burkholderia stagnalis TaxID=1503054 RepID=A0ABX9YJM4_9BURK|nr:hypothetical protein DF158_24565 [Burkholderia stagnalis]RQQ64620.1 hypothetical protein DF137_24220 [Burkholderia stagnalis]RQQ65612.1 hypothetical protein DF139_23320 [Burkholderia stagnalis]RQQ77663.1 hypothetical protein DF138_23515 [Burkholderia stagnalis]RQQ85586.1 hypothetical protein DF134_24855 [Burkholderia stagnalis]
MSFCGNGGTRHGFVIERCDPSLAARNRIGPGPLGRRRGGPAGGSPPITALHGARVSAEAPLWSTEPVVPRPFDVPSTEK